MSAILFAPHNDDETLYAAFTLLRERDLDSAAMHTITVLRSVIQSKFGVGYREREKETARATSILGCTWEQWEHPDDAPPWDQIADHVSGVDQRLRPSRVYAPAFEIGGHDHHNRVELICRKQFGDRLSCYLTYTMHNGYRKSRSAHVVPYSKEWITLKLKALACYESQHTIESGSHKHFLDDLLEYTP